MGRHLVTGGAGFVGSHVVDALVQEGHEVVAVDSLDPAAHGDVPDWINADAHYRWGDVRDRATFEGLLGDGFDGVSHQAAKVGLGQDFRDIEAYVSANDAGTATLLRWLYEVGFRGRFVLASSMVVYGEGGYRCAQHGRVRPEPRREEDLRRGVFEPRCPECRAALDAEPVDETAPLDPRNVYAATKLHQEHLCGAFARETGSTVVCLRYHNVYGPRMPRDTPYAGVASIFRSALDSGKPPLVFEDGGQLRDFVHVRDVARANMLALDGDEPASGAFNVCSGAPRSVRDMAEALCAASGPGAPRPQVVGGYRLGDVRHVFASADRARSVLGFEAAVSFDQGMAEFAAAAVREPPRNGCGVPHQLDRVAAR